ncbi:outer membrane protein assembly factor BamE [Thiohalobacter sp. IOR34]|uniref:outer membrane protein assembly factor BamE n=1 Tax=Thiohalobacter sp. IOR34 TaxID=3057176 RepID=UPI0025AF90EB|nr:outer membrane protein assembly factor BamE [Thiohalobacter sp. IOR34]WJW76451.1 outer membrane protein assembly factor BamE [Thiohalobacter sp. IOR34]
MALIASLVGCMSVDRIPFVHRIDVQQGNVISQEAVNQLRPGMSPRQVRFIMGTPLIRDTFHPDRWDYLYRMEPGKGAIEQRRVTLLFRDGKLAEIRGDLRPEPGAPSLESTRQSETVTVPPQPRKPRGLLTRFWHWLGFGDDDAIEDDARSGGAGGGQPHRH